MSTIPNAPGGALAAADFTATTYFAVSKGGLDYFIGFPTALVNMIINNAVQTAGIAANAVTRAKLEKMAAKGFIGNDDGTTQDPQHLTVDEAQALLLGALTEADPVNGDFLVGIDTSASNALKKFDTKWLMHDPDVVLENQQTSGTSGGTATAGSWLVAPINTESIDKNADCSLSSNQFTLTAGTWLIDGWQTMFRTNASKIKLYNATDATDINILGSSEHSNSTSGPSIHSKICGQFTIAAGKALEIRYRVGTTVSTNGLGNNTGAFGATELYGQHKLRRIA